MRIGMVDAGDPKLILLQKDNLRPFHLAGIQFQIERSRRHNAEPCIAIFVFKTIPATRVERGQWYHYDRDPHRLCRRAGCAQT